MNGPPVRVQIEPRGIRPGHLGGPQFKCEKRIILGPIQGGGQVRVGQARGEGTTMIRQPAR